MRLLQKDIRRALKGAETDAVAAEAARAKAVLEGHGPGGDLRKVLKQPMPALLRMLLGPKVNVVTLQARLAPFLQPEADAVTARACCSYLCGHDHGRHCRVSQLLQHADVRWVQSFVDTLGAAPHCSRTAPADALSDLLTSGVVIGISIGEALAMNCTVSHPGQHTACRKAQHMQTASKHAIASVLVALHALPAS